ncbi:hypothetical protein Tco_0448366 [Tanacetum coccineum]
MNFHQALYLIFELDEMTVRCTRDILRQRYCLDQLSEIPWVIPTFIVIEGENSYLRDILGKDMHYPFTRLGKDMHYPFTPSYHEDDLDNGTVNPIKPNNTQQQLFPTITTISNIKLPILKKEEYDIWAMEMDHYLEYIDNDVWKERKARTILLMAIPKEHLRRFHGMDDAKEIWEAIRTRFGGNANSKKMQKAVLKQQFEAFTISSSEGLEKGNDKFQQLLSQLEAHGAKISTEDANHKFLRSL